MIPLLEAQRAEYNKMLQSANPRKIKIWSKQMAAAHKARVARPEVMDAFDVEQDKGPYIPAGPLAE